MATRFDRTFYNDDNTLGGIIRNTITGIPQAFSETIGQPILRAQAGIAGALTGNPLTPSTRFQQDLFGTDKPITLRSVGAEFPFVSEQSPIAPALGAFAGLADLVPGGQTTKQAPTALSKLISAIKQAGTPRKKLESAFTTERAKRASQVEQVFQQEKGQKGHFQALSKLKGELAEKPTFNPLQVSNEPNAITQPDLDELFNQIQLHPHLDIFERVAAGNALQKLLNGELPQQSQLTLLEEIFGKELAQTILSKRPFIDKLRDALTETANIPRTLITSVDMSAPLRQGVLFAVTKPKASAASFQQMFRQVFSQKNFEEWLANVPNDPRYKSMKASGLYISDPTKRAGGLAAKEEAFMTNLAQKIPLWGAVIRASERAYVSYLNKLRVDVFTQMANRFELEGVATHENLKSLADWVNNATGRGGLGKFSNAAQTLNTIFFSPRLIAARFNMLNPIWYAKQTPPVRKEAVKNFLQFLGVGSSILAISAAAGANVELDPRSTDFGKIRIGNTRWDIWGGFQQWVRVINQMVSGQRKTTAKGEIIELDKSQFPFTSRLDVGAAFIRGKFSPVPSLALELMEGQTLFGEKITLPKEVAENTIPLYLQDMAEVIDELGPEGLFTAGVPGFFGVGIQHYQQKSSTNRFNR